MKGYNVRHAVEEGFITACNYANCMRIVVSNNGPDFLVHHQGLEQIVKSAEDTQAKRVSRKILGW